jgi:hypothetical protein
MESPLPGDNPKPDPLGSDSLLMEADKKIIINIESGMNHEHNGIFIYCSGHMSGQAVYCL